MTTDESLQQPAVLSASTTEIAALEDAVWSAAAGSDPQLHRRLEVALAALRDARSAPTGWKSKLAKAAKLLSPVLPVIVIPLVIAFYQGLGAQSERSLEGAKSHRELRKSILNEYLASKEAELRLQTLRSAKLFTTAFNECDPKKAQGNFLMRFFALDDGLADDCIERKRFADWMREEESNIRNDLQNLAVAQTGAEASAARLQENSDAVGGKPIAAVSDEFVKKETSRIFTALTLNSLANSGTKKAGQSAPVAVAPDALERARAAWNRGYSSFKRGDKAEAREEYLQALQEKSDYWAALNSLGRLALEDDDSAGAVDYFRRAIEAKPDYAVAHYNLALAHSKRGEREAACGALGNAIKIAPDYVSRARVQQSVSTQFKCEVH